MDELFTLVRQLARGEAVTEVAAPKWLVRRHSLGPLLARAGVLEYREDLAVATLAWARVNEELPPLIQSLRQASVRVAPIKGVAYARDLYAAPAERPMADVDLLVPVSDVREARRVFETLGFRSAVSPLLHHAEAWFRGDFVVDLHWNIIAPGRSRLDLDAVWSRTDPGWPEGAERLGARDALLFHFVNLARNRLYVPLIQVVDAARLMVRADVGAALALARQWNVHRAVQLAARFCTAILNEGTEDLPSDRPVGWLGPTRTQITLLEEPSSARKIAFDVATAGSPRQLVARAVGYGANQLRALARRPR